MVTGPGLEGSPENRGPWVALSAPRIDTSRTAERSISADLTSNCFYANFSSHWKKPECQTWTVKLNTSKKTQELVYYWISLPRLKTAILIISYFWQEYFVISKRLRCTCSLNQGGFFKLGFSLAEETLEIDQSVNPVDSPIPSTCPAPHPHLSGCSKNSFWLWPLTIW